MKDSVASTLSPGKTFQSYLSQVGLHWKLRQINASGAAYFARIYESDIKGKVVNLYFIRHARQTDKTEPEDFDIDGSENQSLSDEGLLQAERLAARLLGEELKFDIILASPLKRARETAEIIGAALSLPVTSDASLKEFRLVLPPYYSPQLALEAGARARRNIDKPSTEGSESLAEFHARVIDAIAGFRERFRNKNALVVTHGGVIESAFIHWMHIPLARNREIFPHISCASITHWQPVEEDGVKIWKLLTFNDTHHLKPS